jgi:hypothetical protein
MTTHPTQLFALLFNEGKIEELEKALKQTWERMHSAGETEIWKFWEVMMLIGRKDLVAAEATVQSLKGGAAEEAKRLIALRRAEIEDNWAPAIEFFEKRWQATKAPADLLALCEIHLNKGKSVFVADHAEELVLGVGTPAALQVAVAGAARSGAWRKCLQLLDQNLEMFANHRLPTDLRRVRITCEQHLGMLSNAVQHAEDLAQEEGTTENLALLFQVRVRAGQLKEATLPAKQLLQDPTTSADTLIQLGWVMRLEDPKLAGNALRLAVERGLIGPQMIASATLLAEQLQMHDLLPTLFPKMAEEARKPNLFLRMADLSEMIALKRKSEEGAREGFELWRAGRLPIHFLRRAVNTPLAFWPIMALGYEGEADKLSPHAAVFFQHGGRPVLNESKTIRRLFVDITAFINSYELGLLPIVEKAFGSLVLPPSLRTSLVQQLDEISQSQPDVVEAQSTVTRLLSANSIEVWRPHAGSINGPPEREVPADWWLAIDQVVERNGLLVDYWPKLKQDGTPFIPPAEIRPSLTTAIALVQALRREGAISEIEERRAKIELASISANPEIEEEPKMGQVLLLKGLMAETLAHAKVLKPLTSVFTVVIAENDAAFIQYHQQLSTCRQRVADHLNSALQHLRTSSAYAELELGKMPQEHRDNGFLDAAELCLAELIEADSDEGNWVWIDDRFLNNYAKCGDVPIITTLELLDELRRENHISAEDLFAYRHRLRMADFRFVSVSKEELLYHIKRAAVRDESIVETPELSVLRRYVARISLDRSAIQIPPLDFATPRPEGEQSVLITTNLATVDALADLFTAPEGNDETRVAGGNWLLHALWFPIEQFGKMLNVSSRSETVEARGAGDAMLLAKALGQRALSSNKITSRYMAWLENTVLCETGRQQAVANQVQTVIEHELKRQFSDALERKVRTEVVRHWYSILPATVREKMQLAGFVRRKLESGQKRVISIGDAQFEAVHFWNTAEKVYGEGVRSAIIALGSQCSYAVRIEHHGKSPVLLLETEGQSRPWGIEDAALDLLVANKQKRLAVLHQHPEWFDGLSKATRKEMNHIASLPTADQRITTLDEFRKHSLWHQYRNLEDLCVTGKHPTLGQLMPPTAAGFSTFFRLSKEFKRPGSSLNWEQIGKALINDVGLKETLLRLCHLPRELPGNVLASFDKEEPSARLKLLSELDVPHRSPLARIQIVRLMLRGGFDSEKTIAGLEGLFNEAAIKETQALLKLVLWTWNQLGKISIKPTDTGIFRLLFAWGHAGRIYEILRQISSADQILEFFEKYMQTRPTEFLVGAKCENDVVFPCNVRPHTLLMTGIASALVCEKLGTNALPDRTRTLARSFCFEQKGDITWPRLDWLYDPETFANGLDSFLGQSREKLLCSILAKDDVNALSSRELRSQLDALITGLEEDPQKQSSWTFLGLVLRGQPCPSVFRSRLRGLMERVDFLALPFSEPVHYAVILALAVQAWPLGGKDLVKHWQQVIADFASWLAEQPGEIDDRKRRQRMLLHCIQALARSCPTEESVRIFVSTTLDTARKWNGFKAAVDELLPILLVLPDDQLGSAWPLILHIRSDGRITPSKV